VAAAIPTVRRELVTRALYGIAAARACARSSRRLVHDSRRLVELALTLGWIAGGSFEDSTAVAHRLRWSVRRRLANGVLPPLEGQAWPGSATGKPCTVCGGPIIHPDLEYEVSRPTGTFTHAGCFDLWLEETRRFKD